MSNNTPTPIAETAVCRSCGTPNTAGYRFCMKCGAQLTNASEPPQPSTLSLSAAPPLTAARPGLAKVGVVLVVVMVVLCLGSRLLRSGSAAIPASGSQTPLYRALLGQPMDYSSSFLHSNCDAGVTCKRLGMEIGDRDGKIRSVTLYNQGNGFAAYTGELPNGLSWSDTRATVEQKLGPPDSLTGGNYVGFFAAYERLGLLITYTGRSADDYSATMESIRVQ
jgi:hypothetical protein